MVLVIDVLKIVIVAFIFNIKVATKGECSTIEDKIAAFKHFKTQL
jgi:hypothetical protein